MQSARPTPTRYAVAVVNRLKQTSQPTTRSRHCFLLFNCVIKMLEHVVPTRVRFHSFKLDENSATSCNDTDTVAFCLQCTILLIQTYFFQLSLSANTSCRPDSLKYLVVLRRTPLLNIPFLVGAFSCHKFFVFCLRSSFRQISASRKKLGTRTLRSMEISKNDELLLISAVSSRQYNLSIVISWW